MKISFLTKKKIKKRKEENFMATYKGERVKVVEKVGGRSYIFIPSRQEGTWVKNKSIRR